MHYYPKDQSKDNLEKIRKANVCLVCGRQVAIFFNIIGGEKYIACSGQVHQGITREYQPQIEDYESNIRKEVKLTQEHGIETSTALANIPKQGQLTQPQAMEILKLVYPKAPENEIARCAIFCRDFGLHPLANEVYLIPYGNTWSMVVGIPANRKIAHAQKGEFSFLDDSPRAATEEEIIKQYGKDSEEAKGNIISICKLQGEHGNFATGFGLYPKTAKVHGTDKGNSRRNMANIHAERQGMDRLPGKPMPKYEVIDATYAEVPDVRKVVAQTGEIISGEAVELPPEPAPEPTSPAPALVAEESKSTPTPSATEGFVEWLKESMKTLQGKGVEGYSEESLLGYMKITYKGIEGNTAAEIASKLDKSKAKHFAGVIQEALDKA